MGARSKLVITAATALALVASGVDLAQAGGDDADEQVSGPDAERAERAAVDAAGGGRVVGVEREDEGATAWEVEVVRLDGRQRGQ